MSTAITMGMIIIYVAIMMGIGGYTARQTRSVSDFVLGGHSVGAWLTAFAYGTSYFSAVVFIGYAGQFGWTYGVSAAWVGIGNALLGSLLAWIVLGRRTRIMTQSLGAKTMPEYFEKRWNSKGLKVAAAVIVFIFLIPYTASVYNGLSRLFNMAFQIESEGAYKIIVIVMALLTAIYCYVWARRQATHAVLIQLMGALIGLGGILLWWRGLETPRAVPWWLAFLIVTIVGERVELARLAFASGSTERRIPAESAAPMVGLTVALYSPAIGYPLIGLSLGVLMSDTAWHDVARGTVRMSGLPRLAAVCMLSGYAWALVPALMWAIAPPAFDGYGYDAGVHAITIGFVVSMLLAHAPVIIPAVARREVPYHVAMWVPFAFLQLSLLVRLLAGAREAPYPWRLGGTLGVVGVLLFVGTTLTVTIRQARAASREIGPGDEAGAQQRRPDP